MRAASSDHPPRENPSPETLAVPFVKALVLSSDRTRFLLQKRCKAGDLYRGFWELPGGKMREGESVEASLRRELEEEAGLKVREVLGQAENSLSDRFGRSARLVRPFAVVETSWKSSVLLGHYFACIGEGVPNRTEEGTAHRWVTPEEFRREFLEGEQCSACTTLDLVALRWALDGDLANFFTDRGTEAQPVLTKGSESQARPQSR